MSVVYLFSGDRKYADTYIIRLLVAGLAMWKRMYREPIIVVQGGASGADDIAKTACEDIGLKFITEDADWTTEGRAAGPIRNGRMLTKHNPKVVFAFHDDLRRSKGTLDMCIQAKRARVPVYVVYKPSLRQLNRWRRIQSQTGPRKKE